MVDKEAKSNWILLKENSYVKQVSALPSPLIAYVKNGWLPILASTDSSLGLPLLPERENDDIETLANELGYYDSTEDNKGNMTTKAFVAGYKAAKAKKYDEVDVWKIVFLINNAMLHHVGDNWSLDKKSEISDIMQSLHPIPKFVWVCVENNVPLVENGYVRVEKYEY